jgi:hypothetical protein
MFIGGMEVKILKMESKTLKRDKDKFLYHMAQKSGYHKRGCLNI